MLNLVTDPKKRKVVFITTFFLALTNSFLYYIIDKNLLRSLTTCFISLTIFAVIIGGIIANFSSSLMVLNFKTRAYYFSLLVIFHIHIILFLIFILNSLIFILRV